MIEDGTVSGAIGLCYFDGRSETIRELTYGDGYMVSVDPYEEVLTKLYIVAKSGFDITRVVIRLINSSELNDTYSAKVVIGSQMPSMDTFSTLPDFNGFSKSPVPPNELISVWIAIKSKVAVNQEIDLGIVISYE
jgi:hypothetical protein